MPSAALCASVVAHLIDSTTSPRRRLRNTGKLERGSIAAGNRRGRRTRMGHPRRCTKRDRTTTARAVSRDGIRFFNENSRTFAFSIVSV
jgi:hypothetical protein